MRVNGADIAAIIAAIRAIQESSSPRPKCIVLDTTKGQGVDFLEEMVSNHHLRLDDELRARLEGSVKVLVPQKEEV